MSSGPDVSQVATLAFEPNRRQDHPPPRAYTAPTPASEKEGLEALISRRTHTLPAFPGFSVDSARDSPVVTPASISKEADDANEGLPTKNATCSSDMPIAQRPGLTARISNALAPVMRFIERHWIVFSVVFIASVVGISFAVGFALRLRFFRGVQGYDIDFLHADPGVILEANLIQIDSDAQSMTLDWFILYNCQPSNCTDVNVYFDQNLLRSGSNSGSVSNNLKPAPIFFLNGTEYINRNNSLDYRTNSLVFRTVVAISNAYGGRSAQSYPFDKYSATLVFFAESADGNASVPIGIDLTEGIAVGYNAALDVDTSGYASNDVLVKNLIVTRGQVVRIYAILIVIAIWMVTMGFIMTCIVVVFFGKGVQPDILVVPVATLFAFTSLRGTMPGAPNGFGADIDFVGILPCLALLTFSSVLLSTVFLFRRQPEKNRQRWENILAQMRGPA